MSALYDTTDLFGRENADKPHISADLPEVPTDFLANILTRLNVAELRLALRYKILPIAWLPDLTLFAAVDGVGQQLASDIAIKPVARISVGQFAAAVHRTLGHDILYHATGALKRNLPHLSAHCRISRAQLFWFINVLAYAGFGLSMLTFDMAMAITSLLLSLFFLVVVALRLLSVTSAPREIRMPAPRLADGELPVYTVLVPLFRETSVLRQLVAALDHLDYPKVLLDIKLILEEKDVAMHRAVALLELPVQFETIVVPVGKPQTKPRALNYALQFARGEFLTIYDAEDVPEPDQLRKAVAAFRKGSPRLACLQAELTFYNANENWLTRQFTLEYGVLFGLTLPCLAKQHWPLPLGGTSNHFRVEILREVGAWDPYNVTEDADLGLRLARCQYHAQILESRTYEEANTQYGNWLHQRARWFKGFLQTWLVHMRQPLLLHRQIKWQGIWVMMAVCFGPAFSSLVHPLFVGFTAFQIWRFWGEPVAQSPVPFFVAGISLAVTFIGYGTSLFAARLVMKRKHLRWYWVVLTVPFYWLLMGVAAWIAIWQFIFAPFHWNKTKHGISVFTQTDQPHLVPVTVMPAGPRMITKITGRKKRIIGTVSFGGKAAAFFSASAMRSLRFSWARTRNAEPRGVP
jgi:glycosyltransferase XagB